METQTQADSSSGRAKTPLSWLRNRFQRSQSSPGDVEIRVEPPVSLAVACFAFVDMEIVSPLLLRLVPTPLWTLSS